MTENAKKSLALLAGFCLLAGFPASAETLKFAGVLGNSGRAGDTLVRVNLAAVARDGNGLRSGGYVDRDGRVWLSGGDAINCLDLEGRLIKRYPFAVQGSRIDSTAFAALEGTLYFFGHPPAPRTGVTLFALPMSGDTIQEVADFPEFSPGSGILASTPRDGKLVYAFPGANGEEKRIVVGTFDPRTKTRERVFEVPGHQPSAVAIDGDGNSLYLGGYFGKYVGGNMHQPEVCEIVKLGWDGREAWRRVSLSTPAEPTQFRGIVSEAGGALWEPAWYGFFARFDREGKSAPGKIANWDMRIPFVTQVVDVRRALGLLPAAGVATTLDPLLVTLSMPEAAYLAAWDDAASELKLNRRYGALPDLAAVAINPDGWVDAGGRWWRFDDACNAAPAFANFTQPVTSGVWRDDWVCGLTTGDKVMPCVGRPALGRQSAQLSPAETAPFGKARGFAVIKSKIPGKSVAFATEGGGNRIWTSLMDERLWAPQKGWKPVACASVKNPGDIAVLDDATLVVVDGASLVLLDWKNGVLTEKSRLSKWGIAPDQAFGRNLRLAADGKNILVSDADQHRVLLVDRTAFKPVAQFGVAGQAGPGEQQLDSPGAVALAGHRAVVADVGNQRIVKLSLEK